MDVYAGACSKASVHPELCHILSCTTRNFNLFWWAFSDGRTHSRHVRENIVETFKAGSGSTATSQALNISEFCSDHHLTMDRGCTNWRPIKTSYSDRMGSEAGWYGNIFISRFYGIYPHYPIRINFLDGLWVAYLLSYGLYYVVFPCPNPGKCYKNKM